MLGIARVARRVAAMTTKAAEPKATRAAARAAVAGDRLHLSTRTKALGQEAVAGLNRRLASMAGLTAPERAALAAFHAPVWADPRLQARAEKVLAGWVFGGAEKDALMAAYGRVVVAGKPATTEAEHVLLALIATRKARWERLAAATGMAVPEAFRLHRGVRGDYAVEAVVKAWAEPGAKTMAVPSRELASWSLDPAIARQFGDDKAASVLYEATIPFDKTVADKWVDGSAFVAFGLEQQEVVVAGAGNALRIPKTGATVVLDGKTYTYADREALIQAWRARKPIKVA